MRGKLLRDGEISVEVTAVYTLLSADYIYLLDNWSGVVLICVEIYFSSCLFYFYSNFEFCFFSSL